MQTASFLHSLSLALTVSLAIPQQINAKRRSPVSSPATLAWSLARACRSASQDDSALLSQTVTWMWLLWQDLPDSLLRTGKKGLLPNGSLIHKSLGWVIMPVIRVRLWVLALKRSTDVIPRDKLLRKGDRHGSVKVTRCLGLTRQHPLATWCILHTKTATAI